MPSMQETDFLRYWRSIRNALRTRGRHEIVVSGGQAKTFHNSNYTADAAAYELITRADNVAKIVKG